MEVNKIKKPNKLKNIEDEKELKSKVPYINQHFIFNTLNSILSLCRQNSEEARNVVLELSNYLRFNFNVTDKSILLQEEIEYIKSYLYIQKVRFGDRLNCEYYIEEDINFLIPKNSLYNLIDNSIKHGILKKTHGGTITFMITRQMEEIAIRIKDDGVGMEQSQIKQILNGENYGSTSNLNSLYKDLYNAKLEVISTLLIGTYITLYIPIEYIKFV
ncbi:histidine kinase [Clostridium estertheticum]|uniref:Histidine kinase n=1 Tax=Clostridium estertheticum TaxID=238834 RepID=A0AA47EIL5_9CLOT|nr:histidine kinase [Clostridium estertheticum]MBU3156043.1 histidine kinase [Clostridium estertheticum]MBU3201497.1 histidine kinase [Clostridium estertheticum]WAG60626.1 histidine kinase [Clostridium estertheticum]WAG65283.1 histidine kinase [Clostridium estertheticum]